MSTFVFYSIVATVSSHNNSKTVARPGVQLRLAEVEGGRVSAVLWC